MAFSANEYCLYPRVVLRRGLAGDLIEISETESHRSDHTMNEALHPNLGKLASKHFLFRHLEPHEAERLMVFAKRRRFHAGKVIFRRAGHGGYEKCGLGEDESSGEMAIFAGHERSADVERFDVAEGE